MQDSLWPQRPTGENTSSLGNDWHNDSAEWISDDREISRLNIQRSSITDLILILCALSQFNSHRSWSSLVVSLASMQHETSFLTRSHPVLGKALTTTLWYASLQTRRKKTASNIYTFSTDLSFHVSSPWLILAGLSTHSTESFWHTDCKSVSCLAAVHVKDACLSSLPSPDYETGRGQELQEAGV